MDFYEKILIEAGYIAEEAEVRYLATHEGFRVYGIRVYGISAGIVAINPDTGRVVFEAYF